MVFAPVGMWDAKQMELTLSKMWREWHNDSIPGFHWLDFDDFVQEVYSRILEYYKPGSYTTAQGLVWLRTTCSNILSTRFQNAKKAPVLRFINHVCEDDCEEIEDSRKADITDKENLDIEHARMVALLEGLSPFDRYLAKVKPNYKNQTSIWLMNAGVSTLSLFNRRHHILQVLRNRYDLSRNGTISKDDFVMYSTEPSKDGKLYLDPQFLVNVYKKVAKFEKDHMSRGRPLIVNKYNNSDDVLKKSLLWSDICNTIYPWNNGQT